MLKVSVVMMRQNNIWCVYERSVWRGVPVSGIPLQTECTYTHHMLCYRITTLAFYIFNKF